MVLWMVSRIPWPEHLQALHIAHQLRQPGDVGGDAPRRGSFRKTHRLSSAKESYLRGG
jgi:hypothetical protein